MRIARPVSPNVVLPDQRVESFAHLALIYRREVARAQNRADVTMARNLRRSRSLAR